MSDPRFPIGKFQFPESVTAGQCQEYIAEIAATPAGIRLGMSVSAWAPVLFRPAGRHFGKCVEEIVPDAIPSDAVGGWRPTRFDFVFERRVEE